MRLKFDVYKQPEATLKITIPLTFAGVNGNK